jgi:hypothetical protein
MAVRIRRLRVANPHKRRHTRRRKSKTSVSKIRRASSNAVSRRRRKARRKSNPGEVTLMTKNPQKRRRSKRSRSRRRNPVVLMSRSRSRNRRSSRKSSTRRRRNPSSLAVGGFNLKTIAVNGVAAAGGAIGTRGLTQMILREKNTGAMGYGANALVAVALGWGASKVAGKEIGTAVTVGGIAGLVLRYWSERISQTSPAAVSGLGDVDFSDDGLGAYINTPFYLPSVSEPNGNGYMSVSPVPSANAAGTAPASNAPVAIGKFGPR